MRLCRGKVEMPELTLESLGISKDELADRAVKQVVDSLLKSNSVDPEDGGECTTPTRFQSELQEAIRKSITKSVNDIADRVVLPNVNKQIESVVLAQTNQWGERTSKPALTFTEYLIDRAEKYMTEKVSFEGKSKDESGGYSWSGTQTRVSHMIDKYLHYSIETAMKAALANANSAIVSGIHETVKIKLEEVSSSLKVSVKTK